MINIARPVSQLQEEIQQQPEVLKRLLESRRLAVEQVADAIRKHPPDFVLFAARGSSDNAARYGQYLLGAANQLPVALATPSLFTLYGQPPRLDRSLVVGISQSGQSPDIVAVLKEARLQGAQTVAITNDSESSLAEVAEHIIDLAAGAERSIAATKTYTASLFALAMLSAAIARDSRRFQMLQTVPALVADVLALAPETIRAAEQYRHMEACVVVSRGYNYGTAFEIALKIKELTYALAEPYSCADFEHGPLAMVEGGFTVIAIVPEGAVAPELVTLLRRLRERGAELLVISAHESALAIAQTALLVPSGMPEWLSPMVTVVQGQVFALGLTLAKGYEPDSPRSLRKVTRTW